MVGGWEAGVAEEAEFGGDPAVLGDDEGRAEVGEGFIVGAVAVGAVGGGEEVGLFAEGTGFYGDFAGRRFRRSFRGGLRRRFLCRVGRVGAGVVGGAGDIGGVGVGGIGAEVFGVDGGGEVGRGSGVGGVRRGLFFRVLFWGSGASVVVRVIFRPAGVFWTWRAAVPVPVTRRPAVSPSPSMKASRTVVTVKWLVGNFWREEVGVLEEGEGFLVGGGYGEEAEVAGAGGEGEPGVVVGFAEPLPLEAEGFGGEVVGGLWDLDGVSLADVGFLVREDGLGDAFGVGVGADGGPVVLPGHGLEVDDAAEGAGVLEVDEPIVSIWAVGVIAGGGSSALGGGPLMGVVPWWRTMRES